MKPLFIVTILALAIAADANALRPKSTITSSKSLGLSATPAKRRSFKQDVAAVNKAHEAWKKAHLSSTLYSCQNQSERLTVLANKVADKIEVAKNLATKEAAVVEKILDSELGSQAGSTDFSSGLSGVQKAKLHAKKDQITSAKKRGEILARLAGQVETFYTKDIPAQSPFGGECKRAYGGALRKGVDASKRYHADAAALAQKLSDLVKAAETALLQAEAKLELVAQSAR